jgi:hypothetical protein
LFERNWGTPARAYQGYQAAESRFGCEVEPISRASVDLLGGVDVAMVKEARRRNFLVLQELLGADNTLPLDLTDHAVPFCYPMLPSRDVSKSALAKTGVFVPTFWADCLGRADGGFAWEQDLANRLLPLPIDHRYNAQDMKRAADQVLRLVRERAY